MIYFLEDDPSIRKLVIYTLNSQGMEAEGFELPSQFWAAMERQLPPRRRTACTSSSASAPAPPPPGSPSS